LNQFPKRIILETHPTLVNAWFLCNIVRLFCYVRLSIGGTSLNCLPTISGCPLRCRQLKVCQELWCGVVSRFWMVGGDLFSNSPPPCWWVGVVISVTVVSDFADGLRFVHNFSCLPA